MLWGFGKTGFFFGTTYEGINRIFSLGWNIFSVFTGVLTKKNVFWIFDKI